MRFDEEYRGYRIRYRRKSGWIANIWEPRALLRLDQVPFASDAEGRETLTERVRAVVDAHIEAIADGTGIGKFEVGSRYSAPKSIVR